MPLISIIVPVYNAESTLVRCLDSIANQSLKDFEVLLINDGSSDRSPSICDEYSKKDVRFKIYHQINRGVSVARQKGLDEATGDFIIHADSDDWVESNWLECLYSKTIETRADIVICDFYKYYTKNKEYISQKMNSYHHIDVLREALCGGQFCYLWNKLISRKIILKEDGFTNPLLPVYEDVLFLCKLLTRQVSVAHVEMGLYHYCYNENPKSLSKHNTKEKYDAKKLALAQLEKITDSMRYNYLINWKLSILVDAVEYETWSDIPNLYPEVNDQVINNLNFDIRCPVSFVLKQILRRRLMLSKFAYVVHSLILYTLRFIKNLIKR